MFGFHPGALHQVMPVDSYSPHAPAVLSRHTIMIVSQDGITQAHMLVCMNEGEWTHVQVK